MKGTSAWSRIVTIVIAFVTIACSPPSSDVELDLVTDVTGLRPDSGWKVSGRILPEFFGPDGTVLGARAAFDMAVADNGSREVLLAHMPGINTRLVRFEPPRTRAVAFPGRGAATSRRLFLSDGLPYLLSTTRGRPDEPARVALIPGEIDGRGSGRTTVRHEFPLPQRDPGCRFFGGRLACIAESDGPTVGAVRTHFWGMTSDGATFAARGVSSKCEVAADVVDGRWAIWEHCREGTTRLWSWDGNDRWQLLSEVEAPAHGRLHLFGEGRVRALVRVANSDFKPAVVFWDGERLNPVAVPTIETGHGFPDPANEVPPAVTYGGGSVYIAVRDPDGARATVHRIGQDGDVSVVGERAFTVDSWEEFSFGLFWAERLYLPIRTRGDTGAGTRQVLVLATPE